MWHTIVVMAVVVWMCLALVPVKGSAVLRQHARVNEEEDSIPQLVEGLKHKNKGRRGTAALDLGQLGPVAKVAVSELLQALNDPEWTVRLNVIAALKQIGPSIREVVPPREVTRLLLNTLKSTNPKLLEVFEPAIMLVIENLGPEAQEAIPLLIDVLNNKKTPNNNKNAISALTEIGAVAKSAIPALTEALSDPDLRLMAACALAKIAGDQPALKILIQALKDGSRRFFVIELLGKVGPPAKDAVPDLIELLQGSETVRLTVALSLGKIRANEAIPALTKLLTDENQRVRGVAAVALANLGELTLAIPALIRALKAREYVGLRERAADALGRLGPRAKEAVPALNLILKEEEHSLVRWWIRDALKKIQGT